MTRQRHPIGLYVLFFTEMWERFGFYCMESVFVYYMKSSQYLFLRENSSIIYGCYLAGVYFTPFFGGLLSEWWLGYFLSIILGGFFMAGGYGLLSLEPAACFAIGLGLIVIGNGLFKPNISSLVGKLYPPGDARVESAFTVFYMGINVGALFSPIVAGVTVNLFQQHYVNQINAAWLSTLSTIGPDTYGALFSSAATVKGMLDDVNRPAYLMIFQIAAAGMLIGLVTFFIFKFLVRPADESDTGSRSGDSGTSADIDIARQKQRNLALLVFFGINILFWMAFKQRANSMALWIKDYTDLTSPGWLTDFLKFVHLDRLMLSRGLIGKELFQALNPLFVILFSPLLVWLWAGLRSARMEVSTPGKLVFGFALTAAAFAYMWMVASTLYVNRETSPGFRTPSYSIVNFYALLTLGELCLSPMGLSLVSKLAPAKTRAVWMGMFFISTSIGGFLSGFVYQALYDWLKLNFSQFFGVIGVACVGGMILMVVAYRTISTALRPTTP